jgi:tetratricopeptide (TPR) repeat protein
MKKSFGGLLMVLFLPFLLLAEVDPFYFKVMEQGKSLYYNNQFEEALESFRVAEFGFLENKNHLKEIYLFRALAHYKLKQTDQVQGILNKLETELGIQDISTLKIPPRLEQDVKLLDSVFYSQKKMAGPSRNGPVKQNINLRMSFEKLFQSTRSLIREHQFEKARDQLKQLKRINSRDTRIDFLEGLMFFEHKKYSESIPVLRRVYGKNLREFQPEVVYTLVISYYFVGNFGQALAFYQKITVPADQKKLRTIIDKIRAERERMIHELGGRFTKTGFKKLKNRFPGDAFIGRDLLKTAFNRIKPNDPSLLSIIRVCSRNPQACDPDFYLLSADYFMKIRKMNLAIEILKNNRYYSLCKEEHIEICYQVGVLYFKMKKTKRALVEMNKVNRIQKGYKQTDYYIKTINKLIKGG